LPGAGDAARVSPPREPYRPTGATSSSGSVTVMTTTIAAARTAAAPTHIAGFILLSLPAWAAHAVAMVVLLLREGDCKARNEGPQNPLTWDHRCDTSLLHPR